MTESVLDSMPAIACEILGNLRAHGFANDEGITQTLKLVEEGGELAGAYNRWTGRARRIGTAEEFLAELADVVITTYSLAAELGLTLTCMPVAVTYTMGPTDAWPHVLDMTRRINRFVELMDDDDAENRAAYLASVVHAAYYMAAVLHEAPLDSAIKLKLITVFSRGWREVPA